MRRRASVNRNVNVNQNVNRNLNVDRDVNINRDIDIDVDTHYDRWGHPVAAVGAAIAVGTVVALLPPNCTTIVTAGLSYRRCGSTYYQPVYRGTTVQYVVVTAP